MSTMSVPKPSETGRQRLKIMTASNDGFYIAESNLLAHPEWRNEAVRAFLRSLRKRIRSLSFSGPRPALHFVDKENPFCYFNLQ